MAWPAARPFAVAASGVVVTGRSLLRGWSIAETGGAAARVKLWDNSTAAAGQQVMELPLASGGGDQKLPTFSGIVFEQGIYVDLSLGAATVILYVSPETSFGPDVAVFDDPAHDMTRSELVDRFIELAQLFT